MTSSMKFLGLAVTVGLSATVIASCSSATRATAQSSVCVEGTAPQGSRVLVFTYTAAFRHGSIPAGLAAVQALGTKYGFAVDDTDDPTWFNDDRLRQYGAVVFMSTTGDLLNEQQQAAFERYIRGGGGYVGVHAAADAEYDWAWYGRLVGAYFDRHPRPQAATIRVLNRTHPSTRCLPTEWTRTDEWYDYKAQPDPSISILAALDESSYEGGQMGEVHPIAWYHEYDGGRAWYTGLGHTNETYSEPEFLDHLAGGIMWVLTGR